MSLKAEAIHAIREARAGRIEPCRQFVEKLARGIPFAGEIIRFDYKDTAMLFAKGGVDAGEFEEMMQEVDAVR